MNQPDNILQELQDLSPMLASVPRYNVLKAPEGYFEDFSSMMLLKIHAMENTNAMAVPEGYFDSLPATIMARIRMEEQSEVLAETYEISPTVAAIGNQNVFSVPEGYFETLKINVTETGSAPAKVVSMPKRFSVFKYAAAAVVTGMLAISAYFVLNNNDGGLQGSNQVAVMKEANQIIKNGSFDEELNTVSDAAIVNFLESKGQDVEAALVASLTNEKDLPTADEYLFDDNALDNILKTIDL